MNTRTQEFEELIQAIFEAGEADNQKQVEKLCFEFRNEFQPTWSDEKICLACFDWCKE